MALWTRSHEAGSAGSAIDRALPPAEEVWMTRALDDLGLSVRSSFILQKIGVETTEQLQALHLIHVLAGSGGHLAVREIRGAQLALAARPSEPVVLSEEAALATVAPIVPDEAAMTRAASKLREAGWEPESAPGQWKQWLRDDKVRNSMTLSPERGNIRLSVSQWSDERDTDLGLSWLIVPRDFAGFLEALASMGSSLKWAQQPEHVAKTLLPLFVRSYLVTRADVSSPSSGKALLPLEPPAL
jgi:hypothetical protein